MPSTPLVSLLIPTFNSGRSVADAIASCRAQTFKDLEIVVYDECSRDDTRQHIAAAAAQDPRIRTLYSDTNSGPVRAWRKLLHEARGRWTTFVWSDDLIFPRYVETLVAELERHRGDLIAGCNAYTDLLPEPEAHSSVAANVSSRTTAANKASTALPAPSQDHAPVPVAANVSSRSPSRGDTNTGIPLQSQQEAEAGNDPLQPTPHRKLLHDFPTTRLRGDAYALGILAAVFPVSQICSLFDTAAAREVFDHYIEFENPYGFDYSRRAYGNDVSFLSELALRSGEVTQVGEPLVVCRASPDSMTVNARRDHLWQYWLQYVWAIRSAWTRCRGLSPRMETLIRVADGRVHLCDTFYSLQRKRWPRHGNPAKIVSAMWFLLRHDRRLNRRVSPATIQAWLAKHG